MLKLEVYHDIGRESAQVAHSSPATMEKFDRRIINEYLTGKYNSYSQVCGNNLLLGSRETGITCSMVGLSVIKLAPSQSKEGKIFDVRNGDQVLEEVGTFKHIGAIMNEEPTSQNETKTRLVIATLQLAKLNDVSKSKSIAKLRPNCSGLRLRRLRCTRTINKKVEKTIAALEMKGYRRLLRIAVTDTNTT